MIAPLIGLQAAIAMSHNASYGLFFGANRFSKYGEMQAVNNMIQYKMACSREQYYRKLLNDNIKRSFSTFA